jgi:hypothetical protein
MLALAAPEYAGLNGHALHAQFVEDWFKRWYAASFEDFAKEVIGAAASVDSKPYLSALMTIAFNRGEPFRDAILARLRDHVRGFDFKDGRDVLAVDPVFRDYQVEHPASWKGAREDYDLGERLFSLLSDAVRDSQDRVVLHLQDVDSGELSKFFLVRLSTAAPDVLHTTSKNKVRDAISAIGSDLASRANARVRKDRVLTQSIAEADAKRAKRQKADRADIGPDPTRPLAPRVRGAKGRREDSPAGGAPTWDRARVEDSSTDPAKLAAAARAPAQLEAKKETQPRQPTVKGRVPQAVDAKAMKEIAQELLANQSVKEEDVSPPAAAAHPDNPAEKVAKIANAAATRLAKAAQKRADLEARAAATAANTRSRATAKARAEQAAAVATATDKFKALEAAETAERQAALGMPATSD